MNINRYLDHAVLKPEMDAAEAAKAIELGVKYQVKTVCVRPCDIQLAKEICAGTDTGVITVLAFPHGCTTADVKAYEAQKYIEAGAAEIDMVTNYSLIRSGNWAAVEADLAAVTDVAKPAGVAVKVILETGLLSLEQVREATLAAIRAGADFVKTSTGFNGGGATPEAVKAMLDAADGRIKVKPSGGIRSYQTAKMYVEMGVHRLGVGYSSTEAICLKSGAEGAGY